MSSAVAKQWYVVGPLLAVFALPALRSLGPADQGPPTVHRVEISVDEETGAFTYSDPALEAQRGDHIEFNCEQGNWSVRFIDKTPFEQNELRGKRSGPKKLVVRPNAAFESYKYFVAVSIGDDVYTDDPEIIIKPTL